VELSGVQAKNNVFTFSIEDAIEEELYTKSRWGAKYEPLPVIFEMSVHRLNL